MNEGRRRWTRRRPDDGDDEIQRSLTGRNARRIPQRRGAQVADDMTLGLPKVSCSAQPLEAKPRTQVRGVNDITAHDESPAGNGCATYATKVWDPGRPLVRALGRVTHQDLCPRRAEPSQNPNGTKTLQGFRWCPCRHDKAPTSVREIPPALSNSPPKGDGPCQCHHTERCWPRGVASRRRQR